MEQFALLLEAFGMLDLVLAVFGAVIVSLWYGRGKNLWGLLTGALMGGLAKPAFFFLFLGGTFLANQDTQTPQKPLDAQDPMVEF